MGRLLLIIAALLHCHFATAGRLLKFASPLQSLTIPDVEVKENIKPKRQSFLHRYKAGLQAEVETRRELAAKRTKEIQDAAASNDGWAENRAARDQSRRAMEEKLAERAYDEAIAKVRSQEGKFTGTSSNKYQFVGVVNRGGEKPIKWYARPKPSDSKWSVRLVHVNKDAIIKDLFNRGKVDVFAKYKNTGSLDEETQTPIVTSKYEVKPRSWSNLWNFSPKHFFTDPSGMYWRERRIRPGLYTDGANVYEASYRYSDGRNGMHRVSGFRQFLASKSIEQSQKEKILKKLKEAAPDIFLVEHRVVSPKRRSVRLAGVYTRITAEADGLHSDNGENN
eukprot:scaffold6638_cov127-Cylindrotheca_fusiformis.AAC.29